MSTTTTTTGSTHDVAPAVTPSPTPRRTADLAGIMVEVMRVLNEYTRDGEQPPAGIGWPVPPDDLLDRLARSAAGAETLYPQLATAFQRHFTCGTWRAGTVLEDVRNLEPDLAAAAVHLHHAAELQAKIVEDLLRARNLLALVRPTRPHVEVEAPSA